MKKFIVKPSKVRGQISAPSSKSETLRAILFATLAKNKSFIFSPLRSEDTKSMLSACHLFGAKIEDKITHLEITGLDGTITSCEDVIHAGNSGIVLRFCTALAALSKEPIVITGDHSIRFRRPMKPLLEALRELNVKAISTKGDDLAPLIIQGPITSSSEQQKAKVTISGEDSQYVSALLILSLFTKTGFEIEVTNPGEKPWVALTLSWLDRFQIPYENKNFTLFKTAGNQSIEGFTYMIPGDLSSAAYPIAAALVTDSELLIKNVDMEGNQGDKALITLFQQMGAIIEIDRLNQTILVKKGGRLSGVSVDINDFIDSITILAVVACFSEGETHIQNCKVARQKESDRLLSVTQELRKMGATIIENEDSLIVKKSNLRATSVSSHQDHRLAMSLAVAGLGIEGETEILDVACVDKSYPDFVKDFQNMGCDILLK